MPDSDLVIFALTLTVSVALGTIFPASTQTPSALTPCEKLTVKIQTRAKKDAKADRFNFFNTDKKKKTPIEILNFYKEKNTKASCFEQDELWDIYETEYDTNKYPSWMPVLLVLFLGGVVGTALGAALSGTLTEAFNQSLKMIWDGFYNKFAGTQLFENIALKNY